MVSVRTPSKVGNTRKSGFCRHSQGKEGLLESRARLDIQIDIFIDLLICRFLFAFMNPIISI